ncbi:MAG: LytR C-terminal domain-containing protein [Elusimicrobia bacterium]|nr:LytR C-terminal domain-containing protein [Elusimicrobiota bacterium]
MEFPRRAVNVERALAAALLAAALGASWVQSRSVLAGRVRDGRPWLAWVEARQAGGSPPPSFDLAVYDPAARRLSVLHVPEDLKLDRRRTLERAYADALKASGAPDDAARAAEDLAEARLRELSPEPIPEVSARLKVDVSAAAGGDEPSVAAALALKAQSRSPRAWLALARRAWRAARDGDRSAFDPILFALELRKIPIAALQPARLPDEGQAPELLGRVLATDAPPEDPHETTVEVLNASGVPGLATRAAKMLRLRAVDVLTTGTARPRARTLVFDRVGDFRRAAKALDALDCPTARALTRVDPSRVVDVTVEIGGDCAGQFGTGEGREP